jgi:hypothetical protein
MSIYADLSTYICSKNFKVVLDILKKNTELDVTHNDGSFFRIAIENKSTDIVEALLNHFTERQLGPLREYFEKYETTGLEVYRDNYIQYGILLNKIKDLLEMTIEDIELTVDMKRVLSQYVDFGDAEDDDITTLDLLDEDSSTSTDNSAMKYDQHSSSEEKDRDSFMSEENQRNSEESLNAHHEDELFIQLIGNIDV